MRQDFSNVDTATTPISTQQELTALGGVDAASLYEFFSDRRAHRRYPIILELEYKLLRLGRVIQVGSGRTLNISAGGVLFEVNDTLRSNERIELMLRWPCLLDGVCPMKLVIRGRVAHNNEKRIAISIKSHEFKVAGRVSDDKFQNKQPRRSPRVFRV